MELAISRAQDEGDDDKLVDLMKRRGKILDMLNRLKSRFSAEE